MKRFPEGIEGRSAPLETILQSAAVAPIAMNESAIISHLVSGLVRHSTASWIFKFASGSRIGLRDRKKSNAFNKP